MNTENMKRANPDPETQANREAVKKPAREDVHEQRQAEQNQEAVLKNDAVSPAQSQIDEERGNSEGIGRSRHQPYDPPASSPSTHGTTDSGSATPGKNSGADKKA